VFTVVLELFTYTFAVAFTNGPLKKAFDDIVKLPDVDTLPPRSEELIATVFE
jgi:hypothetical protein